MTSDEKTHPSDLIAKKIFVEKEKAEQFYCELLKPKY